MSDYVYDGFRPYVPVAERRRNAEREAQKIKKKGRSLSPVVTQGRSIASTFWGKSWCNNLERYSDFSNRLPRGRTYVRNGSVIDLQIAPGEVSALVSGSSIYQVAVKVLAVPQAQWAALCADCAGAVDSLVELLEGRFSKGVMEHLCQQRTGLFPMPSEIAFSCSCPDWAAMCKHVAAVLYGIGARLDERPELLFLLRKVDEKDLLAKASRGLPLSTKGPAKDKVLESEDLSALFGLDLDECPSEVPPQSEPRQTPTVQKESGTKRRAPAVPKNKSSGAAANKKGKPTAKKPSKPTAKKPAKPTAKSKH